MAVRRHREFMGRLSSTYRCCCCCHCYCCCWCHFDVLRFVVIAVCSSKKKLVEQKKKKLPLLLPLYIEEALSGVTGKDGGLDCGTSQG